MLPKSTTGSNEVWEGLTSSGHISGSDTNETEALQSFELSSISPDHHSDIIASENDDYTNQKPHFDLVAVADHTPDEIELARKSITGLVRISRGEVFDQDQATLFNPEQRYAAVSVAREVLLHIAIASISLDKLKSTDDKDVIQVAQGLTRLLLGNNSYGEARKQQILDYFTEASLDLASNLGVVPEAVLDISDMNNQLGLEEYESDLRKTPEYWLEQLSPLAIYTAEARQPQAPEKIRTLALEEREQIETNAKFLAAQCAGKQFIQCRFIDAPRITKEMRDKQDIYYADAATDIAYEDLDKIKAFSYSLLPYNMLYNQMILGENDQIEATPSLVNLERNIYGTHEWQLIEEARAERDRRDKISARALEIVAELRDQPELFKEVQNSDAFKELVDLAPSGKHSHKIKD